MLKKLFALKQSIIPSYLLLC